MPPPSRTKTALRPNREEARPARAAERGLPPVEVRYYKRMKKGKSYEYVVSWDQEFAFRGPDHSVVVRLLAGGAQVVPFEATLDPNDSRDKAVFTVTPLAKGYLPGQKLEVVVNGKKVQEIHLQSKAVTRRRSWAFFLLMFLAPWFLLQYVQGPNQDVFAAEKINSYLYERLPLPPAFLPENVRDSLLEARYQAATVLKDIHLFSWEYAFPFYAAVFFGVLWLISLWTHRDARKKLTGKPLFLPRAERANEERSPEEE